MERNSGVSASDRLKLPERFGEVIAFEFELACTTRLRLHDDEREERLLEAASAGLFTKALGATPRPEPKKKMKEGTF